MAVKDQTPGKTQPTENRKPDTLSFPDTQVHYPSDTDILNARGPKNSVHPSRPYAFLNEPEYAPSGKVEQISTIFLTNRECPFRCLMCDLWKNTTDTTVAPGDIPSQISHALERLEPASQVKLYNSGNFFDRKAIPREDFPAIAHLVAPFKRVIVENHPKLCNDACVSFRDMVNGKLEIAMGLETVHPDILPRLNKRMTLDDFERATAFLLEQDIDVRAFILLRPPFMAEEEGIEWAIKSMEFAFKIGVQCCAVIPTREGNGMLEALQETGNFTSPVLSSVEEVLQIGINMGKGRVFMDLWDLEKFFACEACGPARKARLNQMNLTQRILPPVTCSCISS